MHIAKEKPIQEFFHLNTNNTCQNLIFSTNEINFGAETKETLKKSSAFKSFHSDKKKFSMKKTGSLTNMKVYNSRSKIVMLWHI